MSKIYVYTCLLFAVLILAAFVVACSSGSTNIQKDVKGKITMYVYHYGDRSVAPDYHRSYTIEVSADSTVLIVTTYGKELLRKTYNQNKLAEIEAALSTMNIKLKKEKKSACSGGYSESLREFVQDEVVFNGYVYHCDGDSGTLHVGNGDLSSVFKEVVPESVDSLINETMKYETEI